MFESQQRKGAVMDRFYVKTGLAGYGPELDPEDEPVALEDLDFVLADELERCADYADEAARGLAEAGDYEAAWREHERAEALAVQALNFSPKRREAPLYAGDLPKWLQTVTLQLEQTFPLDIGPHERLYVWKAEA